MMKKELNRETKIALGIFLMLTALIALIIVLNSQSANAQDMSSAMPNVLGIKPETIENLPATPEEAKEIAREYLRQEWEKWFTALPVIGIVHAFFLEHPLVFNILFNQPYSFSWSFLGVFFLWMYILLWSKEISVVLGLKDWMAFVGGALIAVILAQIGVIAGIIKLVLDLFYSNDAWWLRMLLGMVVFIVLAIIFYIKVYLKQTIVQAKKARKEREIEEKVEEQEEFTKGAEEGEKLTRELRKIKKG